MAHSFRSYYFHLVWSTKGRKDWITEDIQSRLYAYIGGIIKNHQQNLLCIGGTANHVHLLIVCNTIDKFSYLIRDIKAKSSLFIHQNFVQHQQFAWQDGYASFSISYSSLKAVKKYIENQEQHHQTFSLNVHGS